MITKKSIRRGASLVLFVSVYVYGSARILSFASETLDGFVRGGRGVC